MELSCSAEIILTERRGLAVVGLADATPLLRLLSFGLL